jgi:L-ascorbate metabolism protein UlaG (beta-lactamase superfamily)
MKQLVFILGIVICSLSSCKKDMNQKSNAGEQLSEELITISPISHGTFVMEYEGMVVYVDPVGGANTFKNYKPPAIILVTDIHGDHLNIETLQAVSKEYTRIVAPVAVIDKLPDSLKEKSSTLVNFQSKGYTFGKVTMDVEAIPMYNLREEALDFHPKNRGNGYVVTLANERIYISGDTEDILEMRQLQNIDKAFVCMNLPWTMTVERAADAVLTFNPKVVYPYHYKGNDGLSDVGKFKEIINSGNKDIAVRLLNWYSNR